MEGALLDEMYGDLANSNRDSPLQYDDDSVDIYSGLDSSPGNSDSTEKKGPHHASHKLKDSMDLYEELITEEQQEKEATYNELKVKLEEAQNQMKELIVKLQQMQTQNTHLHTQNTHLKKNICALMKTARTEILRKDEEISRLSKRGGQFTRGHTVTKWYNNSPGDQNLRQNVLGPSGPSGQTPAQNTRVDGAPQEVPRLSHEDKALHSAVLPVNPPQRDNVKCLRLESEFSRISSKDYRALHQPSNAPLENGGRQQKLETAKSVPSDHGISGKVECTEKETSKNSKNDQVKEVQVKTYLDKESGRSRSKHLLSVPVRSEKNSGLSDSLLHSSPSSNTSKTRFRDHTKQQPTSEGRRHRQEHVMVETNKSIKTEKKSAGSSDRKRDRSPKRVERRKEKRYGEDKDKNRDHSRREEKTCRAETSKKYEKKKSEDASRRDGQKTGWDSSRNVKSYSKRNTPQKNDKGKSIRKIKEATKSCPQMPMSKSKVIEENSPNRKLSFMEILNLTVSPVKRPMLSSERHKQDSVPPRDEDQEESGQFSLGDDYCVIDELDSTHESVQEMQDVNDSPQSEEEKVKSSCGSDGREIAEKGLEKDTNQNPVTDEGECQKFVDKDMESQTVLLETKLSQTGCNLPAKVKEVDGVGYGSACGEMLSEGSKFLDQLQNNTTNNLKSETPPLIVPISPNADKLEKALLVGTAVDTSQKVCEVSTDAVSSTVNMEILPEGSNALQVVPVVSCTSYNSPSSMETTEVSSTFVKDVAEPNQEAKTSASSQKDACNSEPDSTEDGELDDTPSSSFPLPHDEDSMMLTLMSIQQIPDAISPLTSPVRPVKSQSVMSVRAPHIKSLSKDFSSVTPTFNANPRKMDVNKENKKPTCSSTQVGQTPPTTTSSSNSSEDTELEEGEIVSDSEDNTQAPPSPPQNKTNLLTAAKNCSSQRSPKCTKEHTAKPSVISEVKSAPNNSPMSKRRFKSVPLLPKTNPSTASEVMDMFKLIRAQLRKKYMKLPKTFPRKSFYSIVDRGLDSFTDLVNSLNMKKLCREETKLKYKLNNIISAKLSKISNNGIVKRIFDQQAPSLKKKLWTFVEDQFDFLFKELKVAVLNLCKSPEFNHVAKLKSVAEKAKKKEPHIVKETKVASIKSVETQKNKSLPPTVRCKTGVQSHGKDLKLLMHEEESETNFKKQVLPSIGHSSAGSPIKTEREDILEQKHSLVRRLSHNASLQDKSDFELLTEQQTSTLTFNLVTDSQMGEIFRCLLQGSDLLDHGVGDNPLWPVGTPRKDETCAESLLSVTTPSKMSTPSKGLTIWSAISPAKFGSPTPKIQLPLNPAVLDESCMLEVPFVPCLKEATQSTENSQRFSILAEDLAVSLTIPSPLKSDSHLSFLHPVSGEVSLAPDSVLSAHLSEDALLDEEDATEQDIHLALDSDNSSGSSTGGRTWENSGAPSVFQYRPHMPMQAVVMEKSNDHFIVKIRHTSTSIASAPLDEESENGLEKEDVALSETENCVFVEECISEVPAASSDLNSSTDAPRGDGEQISKKPEDEAPCFTISPILASETPPSITASGNLHGEAEKSRNGKRKKHLAESKVKKARTDVANDSSLNTRKKKTKTSKGTRTPNKKGKDISCVSPNSLSAQNVVRKKGEVVVTWTRQEDRDILVELKMKGPSLETFSALSAKMNKSPAQISDRFFQLMKLFKKKEKMNL